MKARYVYGTAPINFYPPFRLDFNVNFIDPCVNNVLTFTSGPQLTALQNIVYGVYAGNSPLDIQLDPSEVTQSVTSVNCGTLLFNVENMAGASVNSLANTRFTGTNIPTSKFTVDTEIASDIGGHPLKLKVTTYGYTNEIEMTYLNYLSEHNKSYATREEYQFRLA